MFASVLSSRIFKYVVSLILLACFMVYPLLLPGFYVSHDGELQLGRIPAYAHELVAGQFPIRWSSTLQYGFGSPIFSFMYPLPYWLAAGFYLISGSAIFSLKVTLLLTFMASGLLFFCYIYVWKKELLTSFVAAATYLFLPYHLLNIFTRVAFGEAVAFMMPPVIMIGGWYFAKQVYSQGIIWTTLGVAGLILAHNAMALIFVGPLFLWPFVAHFTEVKQKRMYLKTVAYHVTSWISGLLLAAFFWLPAVLEKKYTMVDLYLKTKDFHEYFVELDKILHSTWAISNVETPAFWGFAGAIIFAFYLYSIWRKRKNGKVNFVAVTAGIFLLISLVMTTSYSLFIWENVPFLPYFQLPWRFLSLSVWATALLVPFALEAVSAKKLLAVAIIGILIVESFPITQTLRPLPMQDAFFDTYPGSTTWHEEGTPIWTAGSPSNYSELEYVVSDDAIIQNTESTSILREYSIRTAQEIPFILQHFYFPGWKAYINGQEAPIEFQDIEYRGLMKVTLPAGENTLQFIFTRTKVRLLSEWLSVSGLFLAILLYFSTYVKKIKDW